MVQPRMVRHNRTGKVEWGVEHVTHERNQAVVIGLAFCLLALASTTTAEGATTLIELCFATCRWSIERPALTCTVLKSMPASVATRYRGESSNGAPACGAAAAGGGRTARD